MIPKARDIPKNITLTVRGIPRIVEMDQGSKVWGVTKCTFFTHFPNWLFLRVVWDTKTIDALDTLMHELVHVIEYIFGVNRTHDKRFYRVLKYLKKEYRIK